MPKLYTATSGQNCGNRAVHVRAQAYRQACKQGLSRADAEDCAQTCVLRLMEAHGPDLLLPRPVRTIHAWLYECIKHDVQDYVRLLAAERHRTVYLSELASPDSTAVDWEVPDQEPTPEEALQRTVLRKHITSAINNMSRERYVCFVLRHMLGWPVQQIAAALEVRPNHVSKVLTRAAREVRKLVEETADA